MDGDLLRSKAAKAAADAVRADTGGDLTAAAILYEEAAKALSDLMEAGLVSAADNGSIKAKIYQYRSRAEQLKTAELAKCIPDVPDTLPAKRRDQDEGESEQVEPSKETADEGSSAENVPKPPAGPPPNAAQQKGQDTALQKSGSYLVSGLQSAAAMAAAAKEMDEKYQITTKISETAKSTYEGAKTLEEDYQISQKIVDGTKSAAQSVQKVEEDYQVSTKVKEGAVQAYNRTWELERQYEVRERLWEAMQVRLPTAPDLRL